MAKRFRRKHPLIGTAPGQKGRLLIGASELVVDREPDIVTIHDQEGGRHTRTMDGREQHIHINAGPRPEPSQPRSFYNLEELQHNLNERMKNINRLYPIGMGAPPDPKLDSRWWGPEGIVGNLARPQGIIKNEWRGIHPLRTIGRFLSRKVGRGALRRDRREQAKARPARQMFAGPAAQLKAQYSLEMNQTLQELATAVQQGRINWENRNFQFSQYKLKLKQIEDRFLNARRKMMEKDYMDAKSGAIAT